MPARESLVEKLKSEDSFNRLVRDRRGSATLTLTGKDLSLIQTQNDAFWHQVRTSRRRPRHAH